MSIVTSGLVFHMDPGNIVSYKGENVKFVDANNTSSIIENTRVFRNMVTGSGASGGTRCFANFTKSSVKDGSLNLLNTSTSDSVANSAYLRFENLSNIQTICMWIRVDEINSSVSRVFLDAKPALANSTISSTSIGSDWTRTGCALYENDNSSALSVTWDNIEKDRGKWRFLTFLLPATSFSKLTLCADSNLRSGMTVSIGSIMFYNRTISVGEFQNNFGVTKTRFHLMIEKSRNEYLFPNPIGLIAYVNFSETACYDATNQPGILNNLVPNSGVTVEFTSPTANIILKNKSVINFNNVSKTSTSDNVNGIIFKNFPPNKYGFTISFFLFLHEKATIERVLFHITGSSSRGIFSSSTIGADLTTGFMQIDDASMKSINDVLFTDTEVQVNKWVQFTFNFPKFFEITDRLVLFAKSSSLSTYSCGLNCSVGPITIYDRIVTANIGDDLYYHYQFMYQRFYPRSVGSVGVSEPVVPLNVHMKDGGFIIPETNPTNYDGLTSITDCFTQTKPLSKAYMNRYGRYRYKTNYVCQYYQRDVVRTPGIVRTGYFDDGSDNLGGFTDFRISCFNPKENLHWDCNKIPDTIDYKFGKFTPADSANVDTVAISTKSPNDCRIQAVNQGDKYFAWGYEPGTCFLYKKEGRDYFIGNNFEEIKVTGCLNEGEKLEWGCQKTAPNVVSTETITTGSSTGSSTQAGSSSIRSSTVSSTQAGSSSIRSSTGSSSTSRGSSVPIPIPNTKTTSTSSISDTTTTSQTDTDTDSVSISTYNSTISSSSKNKKKVWIVIVIVVAVVICVLFFSYLFTSSNAAKVVSTFISKKSHNPRKEQRVISRIESFRKK